MKRLLINRFKDGTDWTIGEFRLLDEKNLPIYNGFSLEPAGEDSTIPNQDKRIPVGIYNAIFEYSPKFNMRLPVLFNEKVSKNRRILIHAGNKGVHTEGCILVGDTWDNNFVFNSKNTLGVLLDKLGQNAFQVEITYKDKYGYNS